MTPPATDDAVEDAVELLGEFGWTEYEARSFVALVRISQGTAREIDEISQVPRARVYDCMAALADRGYVDVQEGSPRTFRAAAPDAAVETIERRVTTNLDRLQTELAALSAPAIEDSTGDVWVLEGVSPVAERLTRLIEEASDELLLAIADRSLLTEETRAAIAAADDRAIDILAASPGEDLRTTLDRTAPGARVLETWTWWVEYPITPGAISAIALVDGEALLASTRLHPAEEDDDHRAVWTDGGDVPIVGMMRPLLEAGLRSQDA